MMKKTNVLLMPELFQDKIVPLFLKNHPLFSDSERTHQKKAFGGIGLSNFTADTDISRSMDDLKKEGSYLWNIKKDITNQAHRAKEALRVANEGTQFLGTLAERKARKAKSNEVAQVMLGLTALIESCDPMNANTWNPLHGSIITNNGKISLNLCRDVFDVDGKIIYKKGFTITKFYNLLRSKCIEHGVDEAAISQLETMESVKVFNVENIPNKKYQLVFTADGKDGAWDLATMAIRGARSCQRWDGEYPKCLIGSILSRFIGVIYLTSGVPAPEYKHERTGEVWRDLGTKMIKRCIVRYAIDRDTDRPCIILEKMYIGEDAEVLKAFTDALSSRAKYTHPKTGESISVPVYYGPKLGNKTRHIYLPNEEISYSLAKREHSYQDTPLRTKRDMDAYALSNHHLESTKIIRRYSANLGFYLAEEFQKLLKSHPSTEKEIAAKRIINNLTIHLTCSSIAEIVTGHLMLNLNEIDNAEYLDTKTFNRNYLRNFFLQRKNLISSSKLSIRDFLVQHCSCDYSSNQFSMYLQDVLTIFIRKEISNLLAAQ